MPAIGRDILFLFRATLTFKPPTAYVLVARDIASLTPWGPMFLLQADPQEWYYGTPGRAIKTTLVVIHLTNFNPYTHGRDYYLKKKAHVD